MNNIIVAGNGNVKLHCVVNLGNVYNIVSQPISALTC